jgi:hypothetical protein
MSTGLECQIIEVKRGVWYYVLESGFGPKNAWDWREHAAAHGPFASSEGAETHLGENHANPGGWTGLPLEEGVAELDLSRDEVLHGLIASAVAPMASSSQRSAVGNWVS